MISGTWSTYFVTPESCNERVFDHFDQHGNILAATWVAHPSWARVEIMGHRVVVGQIRALPHGKYEVRGLGQDGELDALSVYSSSAIFAIHEMTEDEAREWTAPSRRSPDPLFDDDDPDMYSSRDDDDEDDSLVF